jgi:ComF family protein
LHASRHRERGFNQAALLARALPLPCVDALARVRPTPSQTDLPADKRRRNVRGAFALSREVRRRAEVSGRCIVLVDDVATTGATLNECAKVLREAGAREVRAVTAARAL